LNSFRFDEHTRKDNFYFYSMLSFARYNSYLQYMGIKINETFKIAKNRFGKYVYPPEVDLYLFEISFIILRS